MVYIDSRVVNLMLLTIRTKQFYSSYNSYVRSGAELHVLKSNNYFLENPKYARQIVVNFCLLCICLIYIYKLI